MKIHQKALITDIAGVKIGHAQNEKAITGCTVILFEHGARPGCDIRGSASGSRELDPLSPAHIVQEIHGLVLTGGSAFGLSCADGVMRFLEERHKGFPVGITTVPIVPCAVIFDLKVGDHTIRPDSAMAYQACQRATANTSRSGCVGVGIGATAGKYMGMEWAMKSGIGQSGITTDMGLTVASLVVANPYGDIVDPQNNKIVCGCRYPTGDSHNLRGYHNLVQGDQTSSSDFTNTVLGVIVTNASLSKVEATKVAQMAHDGLGRVIKPAHTLFDGDIIFAISVGSISADINWVGSIASEIMSEAILDAAKSSEMIGPFPAYSTP